MPIGRAWRRAALCAAVWSAGGASEAFAQTETILPGRPLGELLLSPSLWLAALLILSFVISAGLLRQALLLQKWSLADALSEEADVALFDANGHPATEGGKPLVGPQLRASSSRFIAMFGLLAILILYLGFGVVLVKRLAAGQPLPTAAEFGELRTFMFSGATLFAPYVVNKFASIFDWLKHK